VKVVKAKIQNFQGMHARVARVRANCPRPRGIIALFWSIHANNLK